jgi:hypothetical protein
MFCLTIAGQPSNKIFQMYRKAIHIDHYVPIGQNAMARIDERLKCYLVTIAAIRKKRCQHKSEPTGKSFEITMCGFRAVKDGVV